MDKYVCNVTVHVHLNCEHMGVIDVCISARRNSFIVLLGIIRVPSSNMATVKGTQYDECENNLTNIHFPKYNVHKKTFKILINLAVFLKLVCLICEIVRTRPALKPNTI